MPTPPLLLLLTLLLPPLAVSDAAVAFTRAVRGHPAYRHQLRNGLALSAALPPPPPPPPPQEEEEEEPSCEQLRTIWRLTKRAAQRSLSDNRLPAHTPGTFGHLLSAGGGDYATHGRRLLHPDERRRVDDLRSRTAGSYERVEEQLRRGLFAERPFVDYQRGRVVYGSYSDRGGLTLAPPSSTKQQQSTLQGESCRRLVGKRCASSADCNRPVWGQRKAHNFCLLRYSCVRDKCTLATDATLKSKGRKSAAYYVSPYDDDRRTHSSRWWQNEAGPRRLLRSTTP